MQNFIGLCGSPPPPAVQEEKEGREKLNYLCQSSSPAPVLHLSYHGAVLGLTIRRYLELEEEEKLKHGGVWMRRYVTLLVSR